MEARLHVQARALSFRLVPTLEQPAVRRPLGGRHPGTPHDRVSRIVRGEGWTSGGGIASLHRAPLRATRKAYERRKGKAPQGAGTTR